MSETIMSHTIEVLVWLSVSLLIGVLLGYIVWYKWRRLYHDLHAEHEDLSAKHRDLDKEHKDLNYKHEKLEADFNKRRIRVSALEGDVTVLTNKLKEYEKGKGS